MPPAPLGKDANRCPVRADTTGNLLSSRTQAAPSDSPDRPADHRPPHPQGHHRQRPPILPSLHQFAVDRDLRAVADDEYRLSFAEEISRESAGLGQRSEFVGIHRAAGRRTASQASASLSENAASQATDCRGFSIALPVSRAPCRSSSAPTPESARGAPCGLHGLRVRSAFQRLRFSFSDGIQSSCIAASSVASCSSPASPKSMSSSASPGSSLRSAEDS